MNQNVKKNGVNIVSNNAQSDTCPLPVRPVRIKCFNVSSIYNITISKKIHLGIRNRKQQHNNITEREILE
jgi:hypothetical protein